MTLHGLQREEPLYTQDFNEMISVMNPSQKVPTPSAPPLDDDIFGSFENIRKNFPEKTDNSNSKPKNLKERVTLFSQNVKKLWNKTSQSIDTFLNEAKIFNINARQFFRAADNLVFVGTATFNACVAPELFFPAMVVGIIFQVGADLACQTLANEYLKPCKNPFINEEFYGPRYVHVVEHVAQIASMSFTIFIEPFTHRLSLTRAFFPFAAGFTAGMVVGKMGLDAARHYGYCRS